MTLLVNQDRRHLLVTSGLLPDQGLFYVIETSEILLRHVAMEEDGELGRMGSLPVSYL